MKKLLVILGVLVLVMIPVLAYKFFVKDSAPIDQKARDLGVRSTTADLESAKAKLHDLVATPGRAQATLTSEEVTALLNDQTNSGTPLSQSQFKIDPDGTVELSGLLSMEKMTELARSNSSAAEAVSQMADLLGAKSQVPLYTKMTAQIENSQVQLDIQKLELQGMTIPSSMVKKSQSKLEDFLESQMQGINLQTLKIENGQVYMQTGGL